jgi:hypothetical protein
MAKAVKEFVTFAIMETIRGCKEVMVLSLRTGKFICYDWDIDDRTGPELNFEIHLRAHLIEQSLFLACPTPAFATRTGSMIPLFSASPRGEQAD